MAILTYATFPTVLFFQMKRIDFQSIKSAGKETTGLLEVGRISARRLEEALDEWGDSVLRLALRATGDRDDAEDVFQTVFTRLASLRRPPKRPEDMRRWLLGATARASYDVLKLRGETVGLEEASDCVSSASALDDGSRLEAALAGLSSAMRTAVHLFYYEGYSTKEIAKMTGDKASTVRSHLHRARIALRISLEGVDHGCE